MGHLIIVAEMRAPSWEVPGLGFDFGQLDSESGFSASALQIASQFHRELSPIGVVRVRISGVGFSPLL